jgi:tyrosine decarboxylase / aspartate 1-decarboxylase
MKVNPYYNISSFVGFRTETERKAYEDILDFNRNWYDRASYKQYQTYEQEILEFMYGLYHNYFKWGFLTIDSSEAIYTALLIHLLKFKEKKESKNKPNFLVSRFGHMVFRKASVLLNVDLIEVEPTASGQMDINDLKNKINLDTFCVVGIAGTTELGNYDNIIAIDKVCGKKRVTMHIDAAIGGFIFPFKQNGNIPENFSSLKSALSINVSGHKYGYARPSAGILLLKSKEILPETFYPVTTSYLPGGPSDEYGLTGSKPSIGLIDLNFNVTSWKKDGYREIVHKTFQQKKELIGLLRETSDKLSIYDSGDTPIFIIHGDKEFIENLSKGLNQIGWQSSSHHNFLLETSTIRIVVRKHFTKEYNLALITEIKKIINTT